MKGTDEGKKHIRIRRVSMVEQDAMTTTSMTTTAMPDNYLEGLPCDLSRYIMELSIITTDELVEQVYESVVHESLSYTIDEEELDEIIADNQTGYTINYECAVMDCIKALMSEQSQRALKLMFDKHFKSKRDAIDYINDEEHGYGNVLYEYDSPEGNTLFDERIFVVNGGDGVMKYDYKMVAIGIKVYERYLEVVKGCYDLDSLIKIYDDEEAPDWYEYNIRTSVARR